MGLSPVTAKELREKLQPLAAQIRTMADKASDPAQTWTPEDETKWKSLNDDYDRTKSQAERMSRADDIEKSLKDRADPLPPPGREDTTPKKSKRAQREDRKNSATGEDHSLAMQAWFRTKSDRGLKKRHVEACRKLSFNPHSRRLPLALPANYSQVRDKYGPNRHQERAQSINLETAGGYLRPEGFISALEIALLAYANVREYADVMRTDNGNDLPWPTVNDTTNKGRLLSENTAITETDVSMGSIVFHGYKFSTDLVLIPAELMEDSAVNLAALVGNLFGVRLGRSMADYFTFGSGAGQPTGFVTAATLGVTAASQTAIAADELYSLKHSVDPAYRPGSIFTFHDNTYLAIKKLKDGFGRYLWQSSLAADAPDKIDGDPVKVNQSMASSIATGNITIAYGQFKQFKIREVAGMRMRRLVERYADLDQEGFVGFMRADSNLIDAGTHPIKFLKQP